MQTCGYKALYIGVDCPWLGSELGEMKNEFPDAPSQLS